MRIAYVTPRYGTDIFGGAEHACRMFAEHLAALGDEVSIFTSCATDSRTWKNEIAPGESELNGVKVRRFASEPRSNDFERTSDRVRAEGQNSATELHDEWLVKQGPTSEELVRAVVNSNADIVIGYPYLYHPIVNSLLRFEGPTVLHPAAHDEWMLRLPRFRELMANVNGLIFQTDSERELCNEVFGPMSAQQLRLGLGTDALSVTAEKISQAEQKIGVDGVPYLLYVGRVDNGKGVDALVEFFVNYKKRRASDLRLVLAGPVLDNPGNHPDIVKTGPIDEETKWSLLHGAKCVVSSSAWEAYGLLVQEAWAAETPVLVNRWCGAFSELVKKSEAGLLFSGYADFEASLDFLLNSNELAQQLGKRGGVFVQNHAQWKQIIASYRNFLLSLVQ